MTLPSPSKMRRGRAGLPLRTLRPLLFGVVFVFVVVPMLVYNLTTLDYSRIRRFSLTVDSLAQYTTNRGARLPSHLATCFDASGDTLLGSAADVTRLQTECFPSTATEVPDLVHFVYLPIHAVPLQEGEAKPVPENFTYVQFAAVQAVRKFVKPTMIILHYPATEPRSFWYTQCQRYLSLHRVTMPKLPDKSSLDVHQRREVMQFLLMLRALRKQGGVAFGGFNTFVLRSFRPWRKLAILGGRSASPSFSLSTRLLQATPRQQYIVFLESTLQQLFERDDQRLRDTPLNQLVAELTLEFFNVPSPSPSTAKSTARGKAVFATSGVLDAIAVEQLPAFLSASLSDRPVDLHHAVAFHLDTFRAAPRDATEQATAFAALQKRYQSAEALHDDETLFGAILRLSVSANRTAELDKHLLG
ncbi:hypothetical protein Poli38472_006969 [Pythium oligandrum]|uniref:Uncharacterized protein n=1 Tax=Pythium oligandrum TaxID=41045 RepID=A0A8K1C8V7_PYTOL|nr:hypothetical protein Poli38472_006969 [Pythium oligandrum]|eukprot:TMW58824.1 hypothetical protein Poli38472_006969 [Pythium oligandrum]